MIIRLVLTGRPITKKNHTQRTRTGKQIQSKAYLNYEESCLWQLKLMPGAMIELGIPLNMKATYYMTIDYAKTKAVIDLVGLLQATCDILAKGRVITDDNCRVIQGFDGSRVLYDKNNPRVEIELIEE